MIENINQGPRLPQNVMLATLDVSALFTNIIHKEGMSCMQEALNKRESIDVPTDFILQLMNIILKITFLSFTKHIGSNTLGLPWAASPSHPMLIFSWQAWIKR